MIIAYGAIIITSCGIPHLMILDASCKSRFTRKIFEFYDEYLHVIMRGLSHVCEVIVELYCSSHVAICKG